MYLEREAYLKTYLRRQKRQEAESKRRLLTAFEPVAKNNPFPAIIRNSLNVVKQLPRLRIQVSFYFKDPAQNVRMNA